MRVDKERRSFVARMPSGGVRAWGTRLSPRSAPAGKWVPRMPAGAQPPAALARSLVLSIRLASSVLVIVLSGIVPALAFAGGLHTDSGESAGSPPAALAVRLEAPFLAVNASAMRTMMRDMSVEPTGDIDHDFVAMMVPHHQGAIDMAVAELRYGHNEQLRRLAQEIIVTQQQEIAAMRLALGEPLPPSNASPSNPDRCRLTEPCGGCIRSEPV